MSNKNPSVFADEFFVLRRLTGPVKSKFTAESGSCQPIVPLLLNRVFVSVDMWGVEPQWLGLTGPAMRPATPTDKITRFSKEKLPSHL